MSVISKEFGQNKIKEAKDVFEATEEIDGLSLIVLLAAV